MTPRRGRGLIVVALSALALTATGCGRDDFENEPRPAVPQEVTAEITPDAVQVSPPRFGAGQVVFVIANTTGDEVVFEIDGPSQASSNPIPARGTDVFKTAVDPGTYEARVDGNERIQPQRITVGAERESSQNDLLLP